MNKMYSSIWVYWHMAGNGWYIELQNEMQPNIFISHKQVTAWIYRHWFICDF